MIMRPREGALRRGIHATRVALLSDESGFMKPGPPPLCVNRLLWAFLDEQGRCGFHAEPGAAKRGPCGGRNWLRAIVRIGRAAVVCSFCVLVVAAAESW